MFRKSILYFFCFSLTAGLNSLFAGNDLDEVLGKVSGYEYGHSREVLTKLSQMIIESLASPSEQEEMEQRLLAVLKSDATFAAKNFICTQLSFMGSDKSVATLVEMLDSDKTSEMALFALQRIPAGSINEQLERRIPDLKTHKLIAVINVIGERRDATSVPTLQKVLSSNDISAAAAAARALAKIGGEQAADVLKRNIPEAAFGLKPVLLDAYLECADSFMDSSQKAYAIYRGVFVSPYPPYLRAAALNGLVRTSVKDKTVLLENTIRNEDDFLKSAAISLIRYLPATSDLTNLCKMFSGLSADLKLQMLAVLTERKDRHTRELALQVINSDNQSLRLAALQSLSVAGNEEDLLLLAGIAAKSKDREQQAARESLARLNGENISQLILDTIPDAGSALKAELVHSIGRRNIKEGVDILFETIYEEDPNVRKESYQSLQVIAGKNHFKKIIELLINPKDSLNLQYDKSLAIKIALRFADSDTVINVLHKKLATLADNETRISLFNILGKTGSEKALQLLKKYITDQDNEVRGAAVNALAAWPDKQALNDLFKIAHEDPSENNRRVAFLGYIRLIGIDNSLSDEEKVDLYKGAMRESQNSKEEYMIISGLAKIRSVSSLDLLATFLNRKDLKLTAESAILGIASAIINTAPEKTKAILMNIINSDAAEQQKETARAILGRISD